MTNKAKFMQKIWYVCGFPKNGCGYFICKLPFKYHGKFKSLILTEEKKFRVCLFFYKINDYIKQEEQYLEKNKEFIGEKSFVGGALMTSVGMLITAKKFANQ